MRESRLLREKPSNFGPCGVDRARRLVVSSHSTGVYPMLLSESEVDDRLASPLNLINRMRQVTDSRNPTKPMELFMPPKVDDIIVDAEDKIRLGLAHKKSIQVMSDAIEVLGSRIHEVEKAKDLSRIAADMSRVSSEINEARGGGSKNINQLVIYQPMILQENHYEVVQVHE